MTGCTVIYSEAPPAMTSHSRIHKLNIINKTAGHKKQTLKQSEWVSHGISHIPHYVSQPWGSSWPSPHILTGLLTSTQQKKAHTNTHMWKAWTRVWNETSGEHTGIKERPECGCEGGKLCLLNPRLLRKIILHCWGWMALAETRAEVSVVAKIRICESSRVYERGRNPNQTVSAPQSDRSGTHGLATGAQGGRNPLS